MSHNLWDIVTLSFLVVLTALLDRKWETSNRIQKLATQPCRSFSVNQFEWNPWLLRNQPASAMILLAPTSLVEIWATSEDVSFHGLKLRIKPEKSGSHALSSQLLLSKAFPSKISVFSSYYSTVILLNFGTSSSTNSPFVIPWILGSPIRWQFP